MRGFTIISVLFACFYASQTVTAQERFDLSIYVVDEISNEPLEFVNVFVPALATGGVTNVDGKLLLELPRGSYEVTFNLLGYETKQRQVLLERNINLDVILTGSDAQLETILVEAESDRALLTRPTLGVETISGGELKSLPAVLGETDVLRGLQLFSGVNAAGEVSNGLSVRGGGIDQNLILLDGVPIFTPTHLFGLFSVFTPDATGSVDLYRANLPARFGGRISSVVDVRTRNPTSEQFRMSGGVGLSASHLLVETPITRDKRLKVLLAGRGGFNDFIFGLIERLKDTRSRFADGSLKLRYTPNTRSSLTLSGFYSYDFYQLDLISPLPNVNSNQNQYYYRTLNGSLEWLRISEDGKDSWLHRLSRGDYRPELRLPETASAAIPAYRAGIYQEGFLNQYRREWAVTSLRAGLEATRYRLDPGALDPNGSSQINAVNLEAERGLEIAPFVELERTFGERLTIQVGLRYVHYRQLGAGEQRIYAPGSERTPSDLIERRNFSGGQTLQTYGGAEPRLGLSYLLSERHSLKAAYAESRQYLQYVFNATTPLPTSRWKVSDNNVLPQQGRLFSLGWAGVLQPGRYRANVEAYYRRTDNILEYRAGADFFLRSDVETQLLQGRNDSYGLEVNLEKTSGRLTGQLNYTFARSFHRVNGPTPRSRVNEGKRYPGYYDQPHVLNLNFTINKGRVHELGFNFVLRSNRPYTAPTGFLEINELPVPLFLERNNARLPTYHRMDFSWTIHNFKREKRRWTGDWVFTVYNLYGRDNAENIYYGPRPSGRAVAQFSGSPLGSYQLSIFAAPVFSLSYRFTFETRK